MQKGHKKGDASSKVKATIIGNVTPDIRPLSDTRIRHPTLYDISTLASDSAELLMQKVSTEQSIVFVVNCKGVGYYDVVRLMSKSALVDALKGVSSHYPGFVLKTYLMYPPFGASLLVSAIRALTGGDENSVECCWDDHLDFPPQVREQLDVLAAERLD